jgi:hypothetical protein
LDSSPQTAPCIPLLARLEENDECGVKDANIRRGKINMDISRWITFEIIVFPHSEQIILLSQDTAHLLVSNRPQDSFFPHLSGIIIRREVVHRATPCPYTRLSSVLRSAKACSGT